MKAIRSYVVKGMSVAVTEGATSRATIQVSPVHSALHTHLGAIIRGDSLDLLVQ